MDKKPNEDDITKANEFDSTNEENDNSAFATNLADDEQSGVASDENNVEANVELDESNQILQLEQKVAELKDLYVRAQAEVANVQRRSQEEIKKSRDYSISSFAKELVVVKDYLEMALLDKSGNFDTLKMGVDLTLKQLSQVFEKNQIKEINPELKTKLDPHLHQAMNTVEDSAQESNTVVSIMQKGYRLNERVLRPAMVTVAK